MEIKTYKRGERIDETLGEFKAYPPDGRHRHLFGKHGKFYVDLTEFHKSREFYSVSVYSVEDGKLKLAGHEEKRWLMRKGVQ
jgi:hypothetical protein